MDRLRSDPDRFKEYKEREAARKRISRKSDESCFAKLDSAAASLDRDNRHEAITATAYAFDRASSYEYEMPDHDLDGVSLTNERMRRYRERIRSRNGKASV